MKWEVLSITNSTQNSSVGLIFKDCKSLVDSIRGCSIVHVRRSAKQVAHCLARTSVSRTDLGGWRISPHPFSDVNSLDLQ